MKRIINYLFPNDWLDIETIDIKQYSQYNGIYECPAKRIIIQKSFSTGRYRRIILDMRQ